MRGRLAVLGGLFLALLLVLLAVPPANERQVPLTTYSAEPSGGKALRLWLETLGYPVATLEGDRYVLGREVGTVLLLAPSVPVGAAAIDELERWTRQGGRLVVGADSILLDGVLLHRFGLSLRPVRDVSQAVPAEPGLLDPAISALGVEAAYELVADERAAEVVPLLVGRGSADDGHRPILAARVSIERGELLVLTVPSLLSNEGLHDEMNARLALSLIGPPGQPGRGQVAVDELHHGFGRLERRSVYALLLEQSWGRALLLGGCLVLLFLVLRGRRLGRAVPVFVDRGRSLGELVTSQASLYRAGGKRAFAAEHLARQLQHDLARAVGLPADATDDQIAARAWAMGRDPTHALRVLIQTRQARSDRALLALTREGTAARTELNRVRSIL